MTSLLCELSLYEKTVITTGPSRGGRVLRDLFS